MSETKTFEELFLSENAEENLNIKELDILLVSDIHKSYDYMEKLKEWTIENKKLFNFIFCTGDMLCLNYPDNEDSHQIAKSESELSSMISYLENMCLNVIYIGGNHDPKSLYNKETPSLTIRSVNLHKKYIKVANDLYFIGIGGSTPAVESLNQINDFNFVPYVDVSNKVKWEGYPYNDNYGNPNYKNSDKMYIDDLTDFWKDTKKEIEENNTTNNIKFVLLSHIGPFYSNTSIMQHGDKCVYMGSQNLQDFLKFTPEIFLNIHGHTHESIGYNNFSHYKVVNPGSLKNGDFAVIKLKRNINFEWVLAKTEFIKLEN